MDIPNKGMQIYLADKFEAPLSEECEAQSSRGFGGVNGECDYGEGSLKKVEHCGQGNILF
jgi:hypothetical protein